MNKHNGLPAFGAAKFIVSDAICKPDECVWQGCADGIVQFFGLIAIWEWHDVLFAGHVWRGMQRKIVETANYVHKE